MCLPLRKSNDEIESLPLAGIETTNWRLETGTARPADRSRVTVTSHGTRRARQSELAGRGACCKQPGRARVLLARPSWCAHVGRDVSQRRMGRIGVFRTEGEIIN